MPTENDDFKPDPTLLRVFPEAAVGGYSRVNGDIEFYSRINALVDEKSRVLDFGAGRAWWMFEPIPEMPRRLRMLRGRVAEVVGTDVDDAVLTNPSLDKGLVVEIGKPLPFEDASFDLVFADFVLEHINAADAQDVADDIMRVLKPGGWFAARTPNKWGMVGLGARAIPNGLHVRLLKRLQPDRVAEDVFPVRYQMNTRRTLRRLFGRHRTYVYGNTSEPAYFGRSVTAWRLVSFLNRLTPPALSPALLVFVQKTDD
ncbi:class I SAM-dependent methyltransferase [Aeromicrobium sp. NPDC092404]|uniref:class I SAM-dependent methyltransferase n=1 Tax=Aeromicrobium sp. NPDC092404 TaxID=3154976 RepID=UPI00342D1D96